MIATVGYWKRRGIVFLRGYMTMHLDLALSGWNLEFEKQSHTLLEYVIGGGTGELPPQDMKFRYLVCDLLMGCKLHVWFMLSVT